MLYDNMLTKALSCLCIVAGKLFDRLLIKP